MSTTDIQSMKSEWKTDCTITCIPQESFNQNQLHTTNNLTITEFNCSDIHSDNLKLITKSIDSYENKGNLMIHSTSSSSSSPSLSFNRPKSSSPLSTYDDTNRILFNDLLNPNEYCTQLIENNVTNKLYPIKSSYELKNKLNLVVSNVNDHDNHCIHDDNDSDHDDDDDDNDDDKNHENREQTKCYNPIEISEKSYSHLTVYKPIDKQSDYENTECDTLYLNEMTDKDHPSAPPPPPPPPPHQDPPPHHHHQQHRHHHHHDHSTYYSPNHESTDMMPLIKKSRISSSNELNCINSLTEKSDNDLNQSKLHHIDNTIILATTATTTTSMCTPSITTSSTPLFHSIEFGINNNNNNSSTLTSNEALHTKKQENNFLINESNNNIHLQHHSDYKFTGFRPRFQYPHQHNLNDQSNNNNTIDQHQSSYRLNNLQLNHNDTTCQSISPLHNYFPSFSFNRLPCYNDYMNIHSKVTDQFDLNNGHEMLHHSILNRENVVDYLHKSNMNTSSSSNNSSDNFSNNNNTTNNTTNNNGLTNPHRNSSHISNNNNNNTIATVTGEHLLNGQHTIPSFHSSILTTINENNNNNNHNNPITFPSAIPNLSSNQTSPLTMSSYTRNLNDCAENISKLSNLNWTSNNTSSHPYRGQIGYSNEFGNTTRRRNATKESTTTLKAWLQEHIKNPYPTKGEKIMLAIITKMTLTQVSTWFANARRRLKKENKMTWTPKHRNEEQNDDNDDDDNDDDDDDDNDNDDEVNNRNNNIDKGQHDQRSKLTNNESIYDDHDIDEDDEITGSDNDDDDDHEHDHDHDLNITEISLNQSRNHSILKDSLNHNDYQNYLLNQNGKINKFPIKSSYNKNQFHINNELIYKKKHEQLNNLIFNPPSSSSSSSDITFMNQIQPDLNVSFDVFMNDQYDKMNCTLNSLNSFHKHHDVLQHHHHHQQQQQPPPPPQQQQQHNHEYNKLQLPTSSSSLSQLNYSIENHLNEFRNKIDKNNSIGSYSTETKLVNLPESNISNWTDMIPTSLSMNKYDSIPFGQQSYQNISFPYYIQENLHVSPYIHGFDTSNKVYSSFNPISSTTNFINSNKTNLKSNHLSEDISLLSSSTSSSSSSSSTLSSSSPSTCSPLSSSLITSTTTTSTITTTINSMYTNFPNTMNLLTSKSFPLNNNNNSNNSQLVNHINTVNSHDRLSFTNLFNHKELFSPRMNCTNDNYDQITSSHLLTSNDLLTGTLNKINHFHYGTNIDSITDNNNNQQRLPFISEVNNQNSTTSITIASTITLSTINSLWSSQLKQLTRLDEGRLDMSSDQIVSSNGGGGVIPFQQFINSSLSVPFTTTDNNNNNNNNNYTTINNGFNNISSKSQPN
ncbi:unnamed protein product, partial [Schistosoma margrebowiei]|uniref:Homeobox domain-containing protein n=1 Tax=Schistosoma margrebowiei TaxID=48269 RepID=A0AA85AFL7_9TREM